MDAVATEAQSNVDAQVLNIGGVVSRLGQRFYPSEPAFPLEDIATRLEQFALDRQAVVPQGWAPRVLLEAGVPYMDIFSVLHRLYESQVRD